MAPTVLITGCSPGGIGHALAKEYHSKGAHVFATARRIEVIDDLKNLGMSTLALDVTKPESIRAVREAVAAETGGRLDVLVNNAGQFPKAPAVEHNLSEIRELFDANFFGVIAMVQEFTPLLLAAKGQIINTGSIVALAPIPFQAAYNASKAALHSYSDTLQLELAPFGVRVVTVVTGIIHTHMDSPPGLPAPFKQGSIYEPMRDAHVAKRDETNAARKPTAPEEYSRKLVSRTFGNNSIAGRINLGEFSSRMWFLSWLMPKSVIGSILSQAQGLDQLPKLLKEETKTE